MSPRELSDRDYAVDRCLDSIIANVDTARDVVDLLAAVWGIRFDQDGNIDLPTVWLGDRGHWWHEMDPDDPRAPKPGEVRLLPVREEER